MQVRGAPAQYQPVAGDMGGSEPNVRRPSGVVVAILGLVVLTLVAAVTGAVFAGLAYGSLNPKVGPVAAGAGSSEACANAASVLMENVQTATCENVAACNAGDLDCALCKCHAAGTNAPGPSSVIGCSCDAILRADGTCVSGAPLDKCTTCQLAVTQCSAVAA